MAASCRLLLRRLALGGQPVVFRSFCANQRSKLEVFVVNYSAVKPLRRTLGSSSKNVIPKYSGSAVDSLTEHSATLYRERFISLTRRTTMAYLLQDDQKLTASEKKNFEQFALSLDAVIATGYTATLQELKTLFDPINPDKDTIIHRQWNRKDRLDNEFWLLQRLGQVLEKANFFALSEMDKQKRIADHEADEGVQVSVDRNKYDVLNFWVLGKESLMPQHNILMRIYKFATRQPTSKPVTYYKRVVAAVRLKTDDKLMLKAFKEVPMTDLEKLLPQGSIQMGRFDKVMMYTSVSLMFVGLFAKWVTIMAKMTVNWTLGLAAFAGLLGGRGWLSYKNKQNKYLAALNKMLYYKNIANNRGLITLVVDRAQDESFKEAILTYTFINSMKRLPTSSWSQETDDKAVNLSSATSEGVTMITLENSIEDWLLQKSGKKIEFDAAESVKLLEKVGILSRQQSPGGIEMLSVLPLEAAHAILPQTPLSILSRIDEADILEGYDSTVYDEKESQYKSRDKKWKGIGWFR